MHHKTNKKNALFFAALGEIVGGGGGGNKGSSASSTGTKTPDGDQPEQVPQADTEGDAFEQEEGVTQAEVDEAWERAKAMEVSQRVTALLMVQ